ncbi:MAG: class I SAM-dependent methyltransferase [Nitrospirota bacterium]|nr:class I SAM-dependent methyltransferase [Nitrospirota bacterium]
MVREILIPGIRRVLRGLERVRTALGRRYLPQAATFTSTDEHRVSDYWGKQFEVMRTDNSYWLNNKLVEESTYRLMTDTPKHWLGWLLSDYFAQRTFDRSLSVCCGDGAHEIQLYTSGKVRFVSGVDISEGAIKQATARFEAVGAPKERYRFEVRDVNALTIDGAFDLILSTGALHHTTNLEELLVTVERMLDSNGYFVVVEFIGPNRFQWTDRQIEIANRVLGILDPYYLRDGKQTRFERPSIENMLKCDPSEAVRSAEVYPLVKKYFDVRYERFYNGTLLHQLHPLLKSELANQQQRDFDSIVKLILLLEDLLIKGNVLPSDFVFLICQKRVPGAARVV